MSNTYNCPRHNKEIEKGIVCDECVSEIESYSGNLTKQQRLKLFDRWVNDDDTLTVQFTMLHKFIGKLVGRGVFVHEMGFDVDNLKKEIEQSE